MNENAQVILNEDSEHIFNSLKSKIDLLKGTRVLITGSQGFLGRTIVQFLNHLNTTKFSSSDRIEVIEVDYLDHDICSPLDSVVPEGQLHYIINCAGIASPKKYLKSPLKTLDVSYIGTKNVFDIGMLRKTKSIIMFSSSEVYGTPSADKIPTTEDYIGTVTTFGNRSCYDIGKNVLETLSYVYHDCYSAPVNVLRPFNVYGPLMDINDGRIVPNICKSMIEGRDFSVYGNGEQTRTYCYVADALVYIFQILLSEKYGEIYNVGSDDEELSALHIAKKAYGIINPENSKPVLMPYPDEYPNQEPRRRCPNITKVKTMSGYSPQYTFEKGINSCYRYFSSILSSKND